MAGYVKVFHFGDEVVYEPVPSCEIRGVIIDNRGDGVYEIQVDPKHSMMASSKLLRKASKTA